MGRYLITTPWDNNDLGVVPHGAESVCVQIEIQSLQANFESIYLEMLEQNNFSTTFHLSQPLLGWPE